MEKIKTLIVDDEEVSRQTLINFIGKYTPDISIIGVAENIQEAEKIIEKEQPQLVFLDVEMPFGNAFDLLENLKQINFQTVFVTAYSHYAMKALNFSASYYLLKPIDIDELVIAVNKVKENLNDISHKIQTEVLLQNIKAENGNQRLVLPVLDGFEVVKTKDIIFCKADGNYTEFYFLDGSKKVVCRNLKFFDSLLGIHQFLRIHKSYLVNLNEITAYHKGKGGLVSMSNGQQVEVSPNKKKELLDFFG
jgi:two-component system, LytTR family, response regulator